MRCKCPEITELDGLEAANYAQNHLKKVRIDGETWQIEYSCPDTGIRWILDYPQGELHGGGPPRLRKRANS